MIKEWVRKLILGNAKKRSRREKAGKLLLSLSAIGSIALDAKGIGYLKEEGLTRKQVFQAVYDLIMMDKAQMRIDDKGQVVLMSMAEFDRWIANAVFRPASPPGGREAAGDVLAAGLSGEEDAPGHAAGAFRPSAILPEQREIAAPNGKKFPRRRIGTWMPPRERGVKMT